MNEGASFLVSDIHPYIIIIKLLNCIVYILLVSICLWISHICLELISVPSCSLHSMTYPRSKSGGTLATNVSNESNTLWNKIK